MPNGYARPGAAASTGAATSTAAEIAASLNAGQPGTRYALKDGTQLEIVDAWNSALRMPCKRYRVIAADAKSSLYYLGCQSATGWQTIRDVTMAAPQG
ncbi:hypothetical protein D3874_22965 [Oleomonas cavernae]|uniref:Uncharacterized protein n=1 Tax=Oleomonas cavernae TaxID=2320859 RepID=A0A418WHK5_9PROT|nr:hypothetical protein [Oleomonas cavernae]RJF89480.1 hypothetical protein D3874_22965 [Oleomonas cavernae]